MEENKKDFKPCPYCRKLLRKQNFKKHLPNCTMSVDRKKKQLCEVCVLNAGGEEYISENKVMGHKGAHISNRKVNSVEKPLTVFSEYLSEKVLWELNSILKKISKMSVFQHTKSTVITEMESHDEINNPSNKVKIFLHLGEQIDELEKADEVYDNQVLLMKKEMTEKLKESSSEFIATRILKFNADCIKGKSLEFLEEQLENKVSIERVAVEREIEILERAISHRKRNDKTKVLKLIQSVFKDDEEETRVQKSVTPSQQILLDGLESDED